MIDLSPPASPVPAPMRAAILAVTRDQLDAGWACIGTGMEIAPNVVEVARFEQGGAELVVISCLWREPLPPEAEAALRGWEEFLTDSADPEVQRAVVVAAFPQLDGTVTVETEAGPFEIEKFGGHAWI